MATDPTAPDAAAANNPQVQVLTSSAAVDNGPIYYQNWVRFKSMNNQYLCLAIVPAESGGKCWMTLVDTPTEDCNFFIRNWDWDDTGAFVFSGNENADTPDCRGNFRMIHHDTRPTGTVPDKYCVSVTSTSEAVPSCLYWGIDWDSAYDLETFTLFKDDDRHNDGQVYGGMTVRIRNMAGAKKPAPVGSIGAFLRTVQSSNHSKWVQLNLDLSKFDGGERFVIEKVTP
jgi:hypothetical protein